MLKRMWKEEVVDYFKGIPSILVWGKKTENLNLVSGRRTEPVSSRTQDGGCR